MLSNGRLRLSDVVLQAGERLDDLMVDGLHIIQHAEQFCFSLDAVLLAEFVTLRPADRVVDLGTGTGVIPLLLSARGIGQAVGLELNAQMASMAARSVLLNGKEQCIRVVEADLRQLKGVLPAGECDVVVSNPPYRPVGQGYLNPLDGVAQARHELTATLADVVQAARYLVKYRGRFAMVHLPERMSEILQAMSQAGIEPKRLQLVYPSVGRKPNILLVEGIRGANPGMDILPPLFIDSRRK